MVKTKGRHRRSGRRWTVVPHPEKTPYEEQYWDDWVDYRDGLRNPIDRSKIRPVKGVNKWLVENKHIIEDNRKLKIKEKIRRTRKNDSSNTYWQENASELV